MCFEALGLQENISPISCFTRIRSPGREKSAFPWQFFCLSNKELNQLCQTQSPATLQAHHQQITFMVPSLQHLPFTEPQTPEDPSLAHRSQPFLLPCLLGCSLNQRCLCISPSTLSNLPSSAPSSPQSLSARQLRDYW